MYVFFLLLKKKEKKGMILIGIIYFFFLIYLKVINLGIGILNFISFKNKLV